MLGSEGRDHCEGLRRRDRTGCGPAVDGLAPTGASGQMTHRQRPPQRGTQPSGWSDRAGSRKGTGWEDDMSHTDPHPTGPATSYDTHPQGCNRPDNLGPPWTPRTH